MRTAQAGTMESMDCIATVRELSPGSGTVILLAGGGAARFKSAMEKKVAAVLRSLGAADIEVSIQDNGAIDLVLGARVEAAVKKLSRGERP